MATVTVKFVEFWPTFDVEHNPITQALRVKHDVTVLPSEGGEVPDVLFYSRCGHGEHLRYGDCIKVYYTGENDCPNFNEADYALSFQTLEFGDRHMRLPLYLFYEYDWLGTVPKMTDTEALGRGFCSVVMRNSSNCHPQRLAIIDAMESYRPLAYGGPYRNNTGGPVDEKIPFIAGYKFNLALENSVVDGYVTEKIVEPLAAGTVPIYWGSEAVKSDFNPESFIFAGDYNTMDGLIEAVRRIDTDNTAYLAMLRAPRFKADSKVDFLGRLADFLDRIVTTRKRYMTPYGEIATLRRRSFLSAEISARPRLNSMLARVFDIEKKLRRQ